MNATQKLHDSGQSLWLDNVTRSHIVNTMPEAFADYGVVGAVIPADGGDCEVVFEQFAKAGVHVDTLTVRLQDVGAASFVSSWNELIGVNGSKSRALQDAGGVA